MPIAIPTVCPKCREAYGLLGGNIPKDWNEIGFKGDFDPHY